MRYKIEHGNIVNYETDEVVLPANTILLEGLGISKALFSAAGRNTTLPSAVSTPFPFSEQVI